MATSVSLASRLFPPAPPARPHITPRSFVPARLPRRIHRRGASSAGRSLRRGESLRLFRAIRPTQSRQPSVRRLRHVHADGPAALAVRPSAVVLCAAGLHGHWRAHRGERRDDRWRVLIAPHVQSFGGGPTRDRRPRMMIDSDGSWCTRRHCSQLDSGAGCARHHLPVV